MSFHQKTPDQLAHELAAHVDRYDKEGKVGKVMHEFKHGELHSGSKEGPGPKVTSREQATAIALSEARKAGEKV